MELDFFNVQIPEDKLHPNFLQIKHDQNLINVIHGWSKGFIDRDNKIVKEFQGTFNTAFWEIYLYACLSKLGFKFDFSKNRPDFIVNKNNRDYIIEAVTTRHAKDHTPEHERIKYLEEVFSNVRFQSDADKLQSEIVSMATERISQSIREKYDDKYLTKYKHLDHVKNKPYLIAVGTFEQPLFYEQKSGAIARVLYGLQSAKYVNDTPVIHYGSETTKHNGASIKIDLFNDPKYEMLSAVIFNPIATIGKVRAHQSKKNKHTYFETVRYNKYGMESIFEPNIPHKKYHESLLDGTYLLLNPKAKNPINVQDFDDPDISIYFDKEDHRTKHRFLYIRRTRGLRLNDEN